MKFSSSSLLITLQHVAYLSVKEINTFRVKVRKWVYFVANENDFVLSIYLLLRFYLRGVNKQLHEK